MNKADCIFCKIVADQLPSVRVYEDDRSVAFMDIGPVVKGHVLVVPRTHYDPITATPDDVLSHLIGVVRRIAQAQMDGLGADGINVSQANGRCAGQVVPHIHFHIIPRFEDDGHHWNWTPKKYDGDDEMSTLADKIRDALSC